MPRRPPSRHRAAFLACPPRVAIQAHVLAFSDLSPLRRTRRGACLRVLLPVSDPKILDAEMDIGEPTYLHRRASTAVREVPAGVVS